MMKFKFSEYLNIQNNKLGVLEIFCNDEDFEEIKNVIDIITDDKTYKELYYKYNIDLSVPSSIINSLYLFIDEKVKISNVRQMLAISLFIGANLESIISNVHKFLKYNESDKLEEMRKKIVQEIESISPLQELIMELEKTFRSVVEGNMGYPIIEDIDYDYNIIENKTLHIKCKEGSNVDNVSNENYIKIINEIIKKEGFENIEKLNVFYTDYNLDVFEIKVKYENKKCSKIRLEKI